MKPYRPIPGAPYGKVADFETGQPLRTATREEWNAHRRGKYRARDGAWEENGRKLYLNGPEIDPALPNHLAEKALLNDLLGATLTEIEALP